MVTAVPLGGWIVVAMLVAFGVAAVRGVDWRLVLALGILPPGYFFLNLILALVRHGLPESIVLGIPFGESPVLLLLWTVATGLIVAVVLIWRFATDRR